MKEKLLGALEKLLILLVAIMTLTVIWQVTSRYVLGDPSNFTDELAGFLLIWLGIFGAAYATGKEVHVAIDIIPQLLKGRNKLIVYRISRLLVAVFAVAVMIVGGANLVYLTFILDQRSASLQLPLGYVYTCIPVGGLLITFFVLHSVVKPINTQEQ